MILVGTRANAAASRREVPIGDALFHRSEWMEHGRDTQFAPNVILVEQPPHSTLVSHFHQTNQFQLFVEGSGTIGRQAIAPCLVHYAGAFTGYGPLVAGPQGIRYFTIRLAWDSGFIPSTDRERMLHGPKRHAASEIFTPSALQAAPAADPAPIVRSLIPVAPDGLAASLVHLGAGAPWRLHQTPGSRGQFVVVLQGSLHCRDAHLGAWDSLYVHADETSVPLAAGAQGARCVTLHMPALDPAYAT